MASTRKSVALAHARDNFSRIVHEVEAGHLVELVRHGKPVALIVSREEFERMAGRQLSFWAELEAFRREVDLEKLDLGPTYFDALRDRSQGREPPE